MAAFGNAGPNPDCPIPLLSAILTASTAPTLKERITMNIDLRRRTDDVLSRLTALRDSL